ncbi:hypothetical protein FACS1894187_01270 [Synergistales bacterium]|nr:hypothetical protein FACS1894187_01270 [Synergistales bacterium]
MDDKGEVVSSFDVDETLALQIWTKGMSPRLIVFNKTQNARKMIRLSWLEKLDRKLSVKGAKRGESMEYSLHDLLPALQRLLSEYAVVAAFKPRLWKFTGTLEKMLHVPVIVTAKGELELLSEDKRSSLWIADMTGEKRGEGSFRPFFPLYENYAPLFTDGGIPITENKRGPEDLFKTGVIRKLANLSPARWYQPIQLMAAGMLLGFSFCEEDGEDFIDEIWREPAPPAHFVLNLGDIRMKKLDRRFIAYARHFDSLSSIELRFSPDSDKELGDAGYARKRRVNFGSGVFGDVGYSVTFFEHEDGSMAIGCKPKAATLRHKGELIYVFPLSVYEKALKDDSPGGTSDDFFTIEQLAGAKSFEIWRQNLIPYLSPILGFS